MFKNLKGLFKTSEFSGFMFLSAVLVVVLLGYLFMGNVLIGSIFYGLTGLVLLFMVLFVGLSFLPVETTKDEVHTNGVQKVILSLLALVTFAGSTYLLMNGIKTETKEEVLVTKEIPKGYVLMVKNTVSSLLILESDYFNFKVASGNEVTEYKGISKKYSSEEGENVTKQQTVLVKKETKNIFGNVLGTEKEVVEVLR